MEQANTVARVIHTINRLLDLAQSHLTLGRPELARKLCQQVLDLQPENLEAPYLLAQLAVQEGNYAAAAELIATINSLTCDDAFLRDYYRYHQMAGQLDKAVIFFRACVQREPDCYAAWYYLASTCLLLKQYDNFLQAALRAGRLRKDSHHANNELYELYQQACIPTCAEYYLRRCLELMPNSIQYLNNFAGLMKFVGRADEAYTYFRRIMDIKSDTLHHFCHTNYLMNFICMTRLSPEEIFAEHKQWGEQCRHAIGQLSEVYPNLPHSDRKLRIGYVSNDFCRHPVAFFIEPLLSMHNQEQFDIFLYSNVEHEDDITTQIKNRSCTWRSIFGVDDEEACRIIREDGIDILVDLGGLTKSNRLFVFLYKPAPVQVTWLGYAHSTGLAAIDYRFTDEVADPSGMTEHLHTEQLYRLPGSFLGYHPPINPPPVLPLPCHANGYITFVAFNNLAKTNDLLLGWWASILKQVPDSCLIMKDCCFQRDYCFREEWLDRFARLGITANRILLLDRSPTVHDHMEALGQGDIALDSYPYNGTTTTCETIWMGVPVVTLAGTSHVSRVSASLLTTVGVPELIAHTPDEYIQIAVSLASDQERLQAYRANLRSMMQASSLMDFEGFARKVEVAYRDIWGKWCVSCSGRAETN
jgi:predicted O-linked N-acetylglucosamine transferase (SPINDLY family)